VKLAGPTYFNEVIKHAMQIAKNNQATESGVYEVLLILTDGEIYDMHETK